MDHVLSMIEKPTMPIEKILSIASENDAKREYRRALGYTISINGSLVLGGMNEIIHSVNEYPSLEQMKSVLRMNTSERKAASQAFALEREQKQHAKYVEYHKKKDAEEEAWWLANSFRCMAFLGF